MKKACLLIFVIGFLLRLVVAFNLNPTLLFPDALDYDQIADNILLGKGPMNSESGLALRMPGYPYFLSFFKAFFQSFPHYILAVRVAQAALNASLGVLLFLLIGYFWRSKTEGKRSLRLAYLAVFLWTVNPLHIAFSAFILSETLFAFFLFLGVCFLAFYLKEKQTGLKKCFFVFSGCCLGLAVYFRESVLLLPLFYFVLAIVTPSMRAYWKEFVGILIIMICFLLPWGFRNLQVLEKWVPLTTHGGITLYDAINLQADGSSDYDKFQSKERPKGIGEWQEDRWWYGECLRILKENPEHVLKLSLLKAKRFWSPFLNEAQFRNRWVDFCFGLYYVPLMLLLLWRIFRGGYLQDPIFWIFLIPIVYFTVLHLLFVGSLRYRMPIEPLWLVFVFLAPQKSDENTPIRS